MERILQLYKPHPGQIPFHRSKARFRVAATGRQFGKSTMALNEMAFKAWEMPRTKHWFISPIFAQAKDQFRKFLKMMPREIVAKCSETELRIELINGSELEFKSGETLDNLRGASLDGVVIDEVRDQHDDLWPLVIRPMLTTTNGYAIFVSTPSGYNAFFDLYNAARTNSDWFVMQASSTGNPLFTSAEQESARTMMSEAEFAQEILAEFRDLHVGKAYLNHGPHNHTTRNPFAHVGMKWNESLPIVVGMDWNISPMSWELGQNKGQDWYWGDEIWIKNTHTQECVKVLIEKVRGHKAGVLICGDSTGNARKTSAAGQTDYTILFQALSSAKIPWQDRTPTVNPLVKDRVNSVNAKLRAADGSIHMWINVDNCPHLVKDLQRVSWKQGTGLILDQTTNPELTHASDAIGYPIVAMDPMLQSGAVGTIRILR